ncbi:CBS domain-containing protein [Actinidia rufa]|uniref:CBS domain-containing protein n=1 Tax=Actinidia rufa TaxID=165716 RepID=A0A7J0G618_9ERIC|nr:CBS domain-containing protein [Actinidia rufa]
MAVRFLAREVSDLCLGKPALRSLPVSATVADALSALKWSGESHVSVWTCEHSPAANGGVGGDCLLLEAIDYILEGAQNLIVPIESSGSVTSRKKLLNKPSSFGSTLHNGREFCWLTQEDVVRFLLSSIGVFSPIPAFTMKSLNVIDTDVMTIYYDDPASSALDSISLSLTEQKSIGVVDESNRLIGEISPCTIAACDETVAAAIMTLSAGDLMAYIDCSGPPEDLIQLVKARLEEKNLGAILDFMEEHSSSLSFSSSCSSDEEFGLSRSGGSGRYGPARSSEPIVCHPWSSLIAAMIQALAHRVTHVWVVEEDYSIVGIVTFAGILKVFRSIAGGVQQKP